MLRGLPPCFPENLKPSLMMPPSNPHDSRFKATFTDRQIAADYLRNFLPPELSKNLKLDSLQLESGSYITPELESFYSDIVYQCAYGRRKILISLLFEHKSAPPRYPHLQLLRYMIEAWERSAKNKGPLRVIIPIIVYHGKRKWQVRPFHSYFGKLSKALLAFIPNLITTSPTCGNGATRPCSGSKPAC